MAGRTCENCGAMFNNRYQLGPHRRVCVATPALITEPVAFGEEEEEHGTQSLFELAQRAPGFGQERQLFTNQHPQYHGPRTRDYTSIQEVWEATVATTHACVDPRFWKLYKAVLSQAINCRDSILAVTKDILLEEKVLTESRWHGTSWPRSHRTLRDRATKKNGGYFWDIVTHHVIIDLKQFNLPGCESVKFEFVDPIWAYISRCQALAKLGIQLEWEATSLVHPQTGAELFGAGIQHGLLFRDAAQTIPSNGKVALINLSWDGGNTVYTGRGACPILLQVMNINCSSRECVGLLGYMPVIQLDKDAKGYAAAKQHVTQASINLEHVYKPYAS